MCYGQMGSIAMDIVRCPMSRERVNMSDVRYVCLQLLFFWITQMQRAIFVYSDVVYLDIATK